MARMHAFGAAVAALAIVSPALAGAPVDFSREVRPILSQNCFKCHGPDPKARKAKLRLDQPEDALRDRDGYAVIVPGDPESSELIFRIEDEDDLVRMPPPEMKRTLTPAERDVLRRWISEGAKYESHWAFEPPRRPNLPAVKRDDWVKTPIDRFILARLENEGLQPSPEADRYTLVRRLYLDLIGLPPTPEQADAFVGDPSPSAYEDLVDRLLASPHYGERWARRWLDLARYADTNGYEKDRPRSAWPYRDWVINALNADMPFDRFTIEQIAGDLLPGATLGQRVATGFHRNTMLNEEGGIDPLEFRFYAMTDRVATTATVWLGLTLGCAQCHTHKYDPITHHEYYQFMAFLNNTEEPEIDLPDPDVDARRAEIDRQIAALEAALPDQFPTDPEDGAGAEADPAASRRRHLERRFAAWLDIERARTVEWTPLKPTAAEANLPLLTIEDDGSVFASGDQTKHDVYRVTYQGAPRSGRITAFRLDVLPDERLPAHGPGRTFYEGRKGDFFLSELQIKADGCPVRFRGASESYGKLGIGAGKAKAELTIDGNARTGWSTAGREGEPHHAVFALDEPIDAPETIELVMDFEKHYAAGLGRFRLTATDGPGDVVARDLTADVERLLLIPDCELGDGERERLRRQFLSVAPELKKQREAIAGLRKQKPPATTALVMAERPESNPRPTFLHHRGEYLQTRDEVKPGTLSFLHPLPADVPRNRLGLARWLVDPRNPLVGRVTVNRHWAALFGRGLVTTLDDFGFQGEAPTHPALLDWLAVEFVECGWSVKELHRLIVTSATYRQSSRVTPELLEKDRDNLLLARGPRGRIEAELIRDAALHISGLLSPRIGGPSVFPPQPASVTEGAYGGFAWKASTGADRYRRGLYTFSKRTTPYAMFLSFDAPSGESCVARREVSDTPLQSLTLLNDAVFLEAAQTLGQAISVLPGPDESRARTLFRRCLVRPADSEELESILAFHRDQKARLETKELDAAAIAGPGTGDPIDRAAWTIVARVLLNLDETITKD